MILVCLIDRALVVAPIIIDSSLKPKLRPTHKNNLFNQMRRLQPTLIFLLIGSLSALISMAQGSLRWIVVQYRSKDCNPTSASAVIYRPSVLNGTQPSVGQCRNETSTTTSLEIYSARRCGFTNFFRKACDESRVVQRWSVFGDFAS